MSNVLKYKNTKSNNLKVYTVILAQQQYYHVTPACNNHKSKKNAQHVKIALLNHKKERPLLNVWSSMTVADIARESNRSIKAVIDALARLDQQNIYNTNTVIVHVATIRAVGELLGFKCAVIRNPKEDQEEKKVVDITKRPPPDESVLVKRRPIVTIMGHVDHGKTTLLDALRKTSLVATEFGGITQHIGAFNVTLETGERVTFLDTPGHAAFSTMRARGAQVTDMIVLVVAADDGVMEQTLESIKIARNANVPIIVAINKIDKPNSNIRRTQQMLSEHGILVDALGGSVQSVNVSALKGTNLEDLVTAITLEAEMHNLRGDPTGPAEGVIIECANHVGRGKLATVLIHRGILKKGAVVVSGIAWAKVRSMFDHRGQVISEAGLSDAVQIIGWKSLPSVGDELLQVASEKQAREVIAYRESQLAEKMAVEHKIAADKKHEEHLIEYKKHLEKKREIGIARLRMPAPKDEKQERNRVSLIVKGDVSGSVEAILDTLDTYKETELCELSLVHYGVGNVNETDLELANAFNAVIYAFNVIVPQKLYNEIEQAGVSVREFKVIYKLIDDLKSEINKRIPSITVEEELGTADVLKLFKFKEGKTKVHIAGCRCVKGVLKKGEKCRVIRNGSVIYDGNIFSIKHEKDDVTTIHSVNDCGLRLDDPSIDFKMGDIIVCYTLVPKSKEVDWNPF